MIIVAAASASMPVAIRPLVTTFLSEVASVTPEVASVTLGPDHRPSDVIFHSGAC
jgi:hypothetical protein